jgi:hypothetical protein
VSEYDVDKLNRTIEQYNKWFDENHSDGEKKRGRQSGDALWSHAMYELKRDVNDDMVEKLTTLKDTQHVAGKGVSSFQVSLIFSNIDNIRNALQDEMVHPSLSNKQPELLMDILNKLEMCTRHVIQNTSIQRLRRNAVSAQKGWGSSSKEHVGVSQLLSRLEIMQNGDCGDQICK